MALPVSASSGNSSTSIPSSNESVDFHPELLSDPLSESIAASSDLEKGGPSGGEGLVFGMGAAAIAAICWNISGIGSTYCWFHSVLQTGILSGGGMVVCQCPMASFITSFCALMNSIGYFNGRNNYREVGNTCKPFH